MKVEIVDSKNKMTLDELSEKEFIGAAIPFAGRKIKRFLCYDCNTANFVDHVMEFCSSARNKRKLIFDYHKNYNAEFYVFDTFKELMDWMVE